MCNVGEWAAVMAIAAAYGIKDDTVLNDVASQVSREQYPRAAALMAGIVEAFDKHGIHMV